MEKNKTEYKAEGIRRMKLRKQKRIQKIKDKLIRIQIRKDHCCEGNPNCNGTTDCMWY